jgi:hypothetical protein
LISCNHFATFFNGIISGVENETFDLRLSG